MADKLLTPLERMNRDQEKWDALLTLLQGAKAEVIGLPRKRPSDAA
jgi:hypothetical protein